MHAIVRQVFGRASRVAQLLKIFPIKIIDQPAALRRELYWLFGGRMLVLDCYIGVDWLIDNTRNPILKFVQAGLQLEDLGIGANKIDLPNNVSVKCEGIKPISRYNEFHPVRKRQRRVYTAFGVPKQVLAD